MKRNIVKYRTSTCCITYHVVWGVKHNRPVLTDEVTEYLRKVLEEIAKDKGFEIVSFEMKNMTEIRCFISAPPKYSVTDIMKYLKGISGRKIYKEFPSIKNGLYNGELWNHQYFCETIGEVSNATVDEYFKSQIDAY